MGSRLGMKQEASGCWSSFVASKVVSGVGFMWMMEEDDRIGSEVCR